MSDNPASWQPDPTGKHDHRYWDGTQWTENVADAGVASTDPYDAPTSPGDEPTAVTPIEPADTTASYPTTAAPPPYLPPTPVPDGGGTRDNRRGLVIGGAILAAVAVAVIALLVFGSGDDGNEPVADRADTTTTTTTAANDGPESLEDLRAACADGDLTACDDLYYAADPGSDLKSFGSTCGGTADPQEGACEATNGGEDPIGADPFGNIDDVLGSLSVEQAQCLADKATDALADDELTEEQMAAKFFEFLADCDISPEDLGVR